MNIYVDDTAVDTAFVDETTTIEEAVRHVQVSHCQTDHLIISVRCDGKEIPAEVMPDVFARPADSIERIDVVTGTRAALVMDAMDQAAGSLAETETVCGEVTSLLTQGKTSDATTTLGECFRIWQQIHDALAKSIQMLELDVEAVAINGEPLLAVLGKPKDALMQIRDALKTRDYVLLADVLQYEFSEVTALWHAIISKLRQEAEDRST